MPRKAEKLLQRARRNKAGWMPHELINLYEGFGFIIREGSGSHKYVSHPKYKALDLRSTFPDHGKELGKSYISDAVKIIDKVIQLERDENANE